ncbi:endonuclease [Zavarzinia compransoris]|uniref:Endonuclease n=1 Tax=Zavarzinia compransoris TaxID=1264899 RepID=A0A317DSI6_9PROT|nr:endonuclease [Zavarzinia compransoris]
MPRTAAAHDAVLPHYPALALVETGGTAGAAALALPLRVAAWNLERCLFPAETAGALAGIDVALLSEMDDGMARSGQRHPTAEIAQALGMAYAYGVEFLELGLGSPIEQGFCRDGFNSRGFHGNALAARSPLVRPFMLRLPGRRQWFMDEEQPRLGERMAIGATVATAAGPVVFVSTHLESACPESHRAAQIQALIAALDLHFPALPVLIGGDLNTGNHAGGNWRAESLFGIARAAGFSIHGGPAEAPTTRPSLITRFPERAMKLDWFLARRLRLGATTIHPALDAQGRPLSDHERLETTVEALEIPPPPAG